MDGRKAAPSDPELSTRDLRILQAIIQDHIGSAEPVGSRALARGHGLDVSPATVRNVMADLEALGYLSKPHTSAGRVPTPKAYRLYVDTLLRVRSLPTRARQQVDRHYVPPPEDLGELMQHTGRVLHQITHWASLVASPRLDHEVYREIRFLRLRENRVLAVLVTQGGLVRNRVFTVDFEVTQSELDRAGNYLDEILGADRSLAEVRRRLEAALAQEQAAWDRLTAQALELGRRALEGLPADAPGDVIVEGTTAFLDLPEFEDREKMRSLFAALSEKQMLLRILERAEGGEGIQVFIGAESDLASDDVAVVLAGYRRGESVVGALGVIGPTRMDYSRVVPFVQYTAALVSRTLDEDMT